MKQTPHQHNRYVQRQLEPTDSTVEYAVAHRVCWSQEVSSMRMEIQQPSPYIEWIVSVVCQKERMDDATYAKLSSSFCLKYSAYVKRCMVHTMKAVARPDASMRLRYHQNAISWLSQYAHTWDCTIARPRLAGYFVYREVVERGTPKKRMQSNEVAQRE